MTGIVGFSYRFYARFGPISRSPFLFVQHPLDDAIHGCCGKVQMFCQTPLRDMADQSKAYKALALVLDHDRLLKSGNIAVLALLDLCQLAQNLFVVRPVVIQHMRAEEILFPADIAVDIG